MDVLLINPVIRETSSPTYFPLGLAYIAKVLINEGHKVEVLDINANRWSEGEIEEKIKNVTFDVVGITSLITDFNYIKWLASIIREYHSHKKIIIGGGLATIDPEYVLRNTAVDIAIIGEGELTVQELISAIEKSSSLMEVSGICFKNDSIIKWTNAQKPIKNLDEIPFPAWDLFPMDVYIDSEILGSDHKRSMNMITSRGCPYRCIYCYHGIFGYTFRYRSADNIIEEIKELKNRFEIQHITFNDDTFVLKRERVSDFCDKLIENNLDISWSCNGRVNLMDEGLMRKMKDAGCNMIVFGLESGSQKMLDIMKKKVKVKQAKEVVKIGQKLNLEIRGYFMIGMLGETKETVQETINFCKELNLPASFSIATPLPNTEFHSKLKILGKIKENSSLIEEWGEWQNKVLVNATNFSDDELLQLKEKAEKIIRMNRYKHQKLLIFRNIYRYYQKNGFKMLLQRIISHAKILTNEELT